MNIKDYTTKIAKEVLDNRMIKMMWNCQITQEQFKFYLLQKTKIASNFQSLIETGIRRAKSAGDTELAAEMQKNLADELGENSAGEIIPENSHNYWRSQFLSSLSIKETHIKDSELLSTVIAHANMLIKFEDEGDPYTIAGAILMIERIVPLEYRAVQKSRNYLYPSVFIINQNDSGAIKNQKVTACRYIDDHIVHDAKEHFPALLKTLEKHQSNKKVINNIIRGIEMVKRFRLNFFDSIVYAWCKN